MGMIFTHAEHFLENTQDTVFLEIGSDSYEGSTEYLSHLALRCGVDFYSVDADKDASQRLSHLPVHWHVAWGSEWCEKGIECCSFNICRCRRNVRIDVDSIVDIAW